MKTPEEKYRNDPKYHNMVDTLVSLIENYEFTPSEIREISMFACYVHETNKVHPSMIFPNKQFFESCECSTLGGGNVLNKIKYKGQKVCKKLHLLSWIKEE